VRFLRPNTGNEAEDSMSQAVGCIVFAGVLMIAIVVGIVTGLIL
jgi:hypothetical protein